MSSIVGSASYGLGSRVGDVGVNEVPFSIVVVYCLNKATLNTL